MKRREFLAVAAAAAALPFAAAAQQATRVPRIGLLSPGRSEESDPSRNTIHAHVLRLRELGYIEGQNIVFERWFAEASPDRLRDGAADLAGRQVDMIVALSTTAARAAKRATSTIPIVGIGMADPVEDELVASLARPGGNVTGTSFLGPELVAKRLQLLQQVVPQLSRVTVLWHPQAYSERTMTGMLKEIEDAARMLAVQLQFAPIAGPDEIPDAFAAAARERAQAIIMFPSPMLFGAYHRIASLAAGARLPAMFAAREGVDAGGLMSYGVNLQDLSRQTAAYVDKILKGAKPAELPVEQATKFELVINLAAAKALGLTFSRDFQLLSDAVVE
jgi:putative ABC transport system substrate-binding protein